MSKVFYLKNYGYVHLSAGDLLRAERMRPGSKVGEEIENHIRKGTIVPVEVTCTLLENVRKRFLLIKKNAYSMEFIFEKKTKAMKESGKENFLIDGFPRNKDNLDGWNRQMGDKTEVKGVLFFECSEKVLFTREISQSFTQVLFSNKFCKDMC